LEVEGIDRMYLNVYQPRLQSDKQVAAIFRHHRGQAVPSSALPLAARRLRGHEDQAVSHQRAHPVGEFAQSITPGQTTYHLRRLRLHGLIARVPKSHRYRVTEASGQMMIVWQPVSNVSYVRIGGNREQQLAA
jgi:hypothetical protein